MIDDGVMKQKTLVATAAELATAREGRGMSQVDISQRIKLQVRQVNALEEGQWDALPGKSFVRGALRSYGKLLDVDVAPLLESIGGYAEPSPVHGMRPLDATISRSSGLGFNGGGRGSPTLWVIGGLIGVVALVLYFGSDGESPRIPSWLPSADAPSGAPVNSATTTPAAEPSSAPAPSFSASVADTSAAPSPAAPGTGAAAPTMAPSATPTLTPTLTPSATPSVTSPVTPSVLDALSVLPHRPPSSAAAPGTLESNSAVVSPQPTSQVATAAGAERAAASASTSAAGARARGLMRFDATRDAWVEVRQADGSAVHNGLVKAGSSIELRGTPPLRLTLGNASRLVLVYEGKVQDLAPYTQGRDIARLELQ